MGLIDRLRLASAYDAKEARLDLEEKIKLFHRGWKKAQPIVQKRLLRRMIDCMYYTSEGIKTYYFLDANKAEKHQSLENKKAGDQTSSAFLENRKIHRFPYNLPASNQRVKSSPVGWIGATGAKSDEPFANLANYHDIIKFSGEKSNSYFAEFFDLYRKGLSLNDISLKTNQAVSTIRSVLIDGGLALRTNKTANSTTIKEKDRTLTGQVSYGYYVIDGALVADPREQKIIKKILELWQSGMAFIAIKRWLNNKKIPSKWRRLWNDKTVAAIIRRHNNQIQKPKKSEASGNLSF